MRNDVNKRPKRPGDLAALLAATPPEDHDFLQGIVLSMNITTGVNSVDLGGGITADNCVIVGDHGSMAAGTPVLLVRIRRRYFILGPMSNGGVPALGTVSLVYTASGSFDPSVYPGIRGVSVTAVGGGGAGGGAAATGAGQTAAGGGGGGGGAATRLIPVSSFPGGSITVTVGAGGTGTSGGGGNSGTNSSFGSLVVATGGAGGAASTAAATISLAIGGAGGAGTTGSVLMVGQYGSAGLRLGNSAAQYAGGTGGSSHMGGGGGGGNNSNGLAGGAYGGGGGGATNSVSAGARTGGNGAAGIVLVEVLL